MPTLPTGRALLDAPAILARAGLALDMQYADFGAGTLGHFVFPACDMVGPKGRVYAVDILKGALAGIESRAKMEQVINLTAVWGNIEKVGGVDIAAGSLDLVSVVNIVKLLVKSPSAVDEIKRVLKAKGKILLVDWKLSGGSFGPPAERRLAPETLIPHITKAGFKVEHSFEAGPHHWGLVLARP